MKIRTETTNLHLSHRSAVFLFLIKYMIPDHGSVDQPVIGPKIQGVDRPFPSKHLSCRLDAGAGRPPCQHRRETPACHRRELPGLINDADHRIGEIGACHAVHNHASDRQLPLIALASSLTFDQRRQQCFVSFRRNDRYIRQILRLFPSSDLLQTRRVLFRFLPLQLLLISLLLFYFRVIAVYRTFSVQDFSLRGALIFSFFSSINALTSPCFSSFSFFSDSTSRRVSSSSSFSSSMS